MTILALLYEDVAQLKVYTKDCTVPCVEIRGSYQFIKYIRLHLNETLGVPTTIVARGCDVDVYVKDVATFRLIVDDSFITGYTAKLL